MQFPVYLHSGKIKFTLFFFHNFTSNNHIKFQIFFFFNINSSIDFILNFFIQLLPEEYSRSHTPAYTLFRKGKGNKYCGCRIPFSRVLCQNLSQFPQPLCCLVWHLNAPSLSSGEAGGGGGAVRQSGIKRQKANSDLIKRFASGQLQLQL